MTDKLVIRASAVGFLAGIALLVASTLGLALTNCIARSEDDGWRLL